jgi:ATP-dependent Clp protease ATP-binding subunit ClpC
MVPRLPELDAALEAAGRRAHARGEAATTLDLLAMILEEDSLRALVGPVGPGALARPREEPSGLLERAIEEAGKLAARCGAPAAHRLHALAALCRDTEGAAYGALVAAGHDPPRIRAAALRELTTPLPRRRSKAEPAPAEGRKQTVLGDRAPVVPVRRVAPLPRPSATTDPTSPRPLAAISGPLRDLVDAARREEAAPLIGRARELDLLIDMLGQRRGTIVCVVGEPGTGKTALVRALAARVAQAPGSVPALEGADLFEANPDLSPTQITHVRRFVLFYDAPPEPATVAALLREGVPAILALTPADLRRLLEAVPALGGRMAQVLLSELGPGATLEILRANQEDYGQHHGVRYDDGALTAAGRLAPRFVSERFLPDRALALLDLAGARARRVGRTHVDEAGVAELVAEAAGVPVDRLLVRDAERLLQMEERLARVVVGHAHVLARVAEVIRRNYAGFRAQRPVGSFLFLGPTGVGKTETAKALASFLMGSESAMIRLDMSEYAEPHSIARLIGSPPGYVGHEDGGQLTENVRRRPDTVVLLDEIEKAHRDLLPILLQILDDGRLTDGRGRTVDFANTVVILTSNLGSTARKPADVITAARQAFPIELWNRIEEPLVFAPLDADEIAEIARRLARTSSDRLERERGIRYELDDGAVSYLLKHGGFDRELGARPMRAALGRLVEAPLANAILAGEVLPGQVIRVARRGARLTFAKS